MTLRVEILKDKFSQSLGLPFKELLPESAIKLAISELKIKYTITNLAEHLLNISHDKINYLKNEKVVFDARCAKRTIAMEAQKLSQFLANPSKLYMRLQMS